MASLVGRLSKCQNFWHHPASLKNKFASYFSPSACHLYRQYSSGILQGDTVRIGCASGFWGDTAVSAPQLVHKGNIDFLVFDYLSEITMSLLSAAQHKFPDLGYAPDFVQVAMAPLLKDIKAKGVRVISNAGGVNPLGCAAALRKVADKAGVDLKVAVVTGDNLMSMKSQIEAAGVTDFNSGNPFPESVTSMTTYLGASSIRQALDMGADIVVTGRCTDSALVLAPLIHKFQWEPDNFDLLASGSLAGHIIECGAQATGGNFTDWHLVPDWHNIGFPIVECAKNGDFIVTKPPKTGGLVSTATVSEQMCYEIGDPQRYILPDVTCNFSKVQMRDIGKHEVLVQGAQGTAPTDTYKICSTYKDGYRLTAVATLGGPRSVEKGRKTAQAMIDRTRGIFKMLGLEDYTKTHLQIIGAEDTYGPHAKSGPGPREVVIWLAAHHQNKKALQILSMEIAPAGTGMAPGLMGIAGGRPKVSPTLKLFSFLYPKEKVKTQIHFEDSIHDHCTPEVSFATNDTQETESSTEPPPPTPGSNTYRLEDLAYTRSGDKGNNCNIGVIARHPSYLPYLRHALTAEAVDSYMHHVFDDTSGSVDDRVSRYDLPGIHAMNFVLHNSLGGGGIASLRSDPQGKGYGQMLLDYEITNMPDILKLASNR